MTNTPDDNVEPPTELLMQGRLRVSHGEDDPRGHFTAAQHDYLLNPLRSTRIAKRSQGGKELSYLEAWDVRAHLIRLFGFGNFDSEVTDSHLMFERAVKIGSGDNQKDGIEVAYKATVRLVIRDPAGMEVCRFAETAVGSATGSVNYGDLHDNAVKQAASDGLKRCAINLGTQFGLSLYDNGRRTDVVRTTLVAPEGAKPPGTQEAAGSDLSDEAKAALEHSLGAEVVPETPAETPPEEGPRFDRRIDTPAAAQDAVQEMADS